MAVFEGEDHRNHYSPCALTVLGPADQSNSSVEKAGLLGSVPMRLLKADDRCRLTGATLAKAVADDLADGLIPFYVVATLGTTGTCAFDCLEEIGPICNENDIWLHVDAAYAGTYQA